jgi:uncharacterized protein
LIHPDTQVKQTHKGLGVFATRKFFRGEILWIADDLDVLIPVDEYLRIDGIFRRKLDRYSYLNSENHAVIAWDEGKFVNHSCSPNSTGILQFDNISVALRDIEKGEEMVEDYYSYYGHFETFECRCGAPNCRKMITHDNTYTPTLRLDLVDIADVIVTHNPVLLQVPSSYQKEILRQINEYRKQEKRA